MKAEIVIAGFGGQGVLFAGTLLAQAALEENKHTTWFPSYGAEVRGGTAHSTIVVSDDEIGSPVVSNPGVLIALNEMSFKRFFPKVKPGALVIANSSLVHDIPGSSGVVSLPATELALKELNEVRVANTIAVGAYLGLSGILKLDSAVKACEAVLADRPALVKVNQQALKLGFEYFKKAQGAKT